MLESQNTDSRKLYSLLELSKSIEGVIKRNFSSSYWVKAEIAKLNYYPKSGHCYPDLVEKTNGKVVAQLRATIWSGTYIDIANKFRKITKEHLSDGMMVLIRVSVSFNPVYGLSLQIIDIEPSFTLGELAREKQQSIDRLMEEGLFFKNKQVTPALLLQRLAIVSVETSKGYHDFLNVIENNDNGYHFFHMLFPALLQGEGAIRSISEQLDRIKKVAHHFDVVLIIRGGGGDVGLSSFDSYKLSSKVANFPLPVITGIGHSTNFTVTEQVAYENKITPTEVAYYLIEGFKQFELRIEMAIDILINTVNQSITLEKTRIKYNVMHLKTMTDNMMYENKLLIADQYSKLKNQISQMVEKQNAKIIESMIKLGSSISKLLMTSNFRITTIESKVNLLHPDNVLKRGYSITTKNGKVVSDSDELIENDIIETRLKKGKITSKIIK